jgi:WD40 repeat protein
MLASGGGDKTIKLWNVNTGELMKTFCGHRGQVYCVAFSPAGKTLASGSFDDGVKLWSIDAGRRSATLKCNGFVYGVSFSPDGNTLAAGSGVKVKLWNLDHSR